ncbi:MAG: replicative DNA helicase [Prevotellaceae bacterium]|nr:replicative DNA helicase [Prevotellaceae bacterium]
MEQKRPATKKPKPIVQPLDYGKVPPQALELEELVLGALMIEHSAHDIVSTLLKPESFYKEAHQKIYAAIVDLATRQEPVDLYTVQEQLKHNGTLEEAGGAYYIAMLTAKVASAAHLEFHAKIIAQKYLARELIHFATTVQTKAFDDSMDVDDLMQEAEGKLFEMSQRNTQREVTQIDPIIAEAIARIQTAANMDGNLSGIPSGFHALDKITSGWQKSELIIVAARPAMGKTAFVLSMAKNIAIDHHLPVGLFSLEMSNVQLVNRLIMNVCKIPGDKIKSGRLEKYEWAQLDAKLHDLEGAPIYVDDTPSLSILELRTKARRLVREHAVKLIMIDYLQLMNASGMNFFSREQEVSLISRSLKALAKELDIPIIALSQLNRNLVSRGSDSVHEAKKPQLSDLRESGAIEQDADVVCFIHRPEYYKIFEDPVTHKDMRRVAQIIIAKHRNGATGEVDLRFVHEYTRFMNESEDIDVITVGSRSNNTSDYPSADDLPAYELPPSSDVPY